MERFAPGSLVDGTYRIESLISETERAHVYDVKHTRFDGLSLVLKVVPLTLTSDFERDSQALASLTAPAFSAIVDRGVLPDGRHYRIVRRFEGPSLREALTTAAFDDDRASELLVGLAAAAFEAQRNGMGPLDLSPDNLMFERGTGSNLGMLRALKAGETEPNADADNAALVALRKVLEKGRVTALSKGWAPPAPPSSQPGTKIGGWRVIRSISESLSASVYDVVGENNEVGVLKIAGPIADKTRFEREMQLLTMVKSPHVVKIIGFGTHEAAPYLVMELLEGLTLEVRLRTSGPFPIPAALEVVEQMLAGAEDIALAGGGPSDFSLDHCYAAENPWRVKLTHPAVISEGRFKFYASGRVDRSSMDTWSAAVTLYELLAGRLPFPVSRHSLAKAWMGLPLPLNTRRNEVPEALSKLVTDVLSGDLTLTRVALKERFAQFRTAPSPVKAVPVHVATKVSVYDDSKVILPPKRDAVVSQAQHVKPMRANLAPPPPIDWRISAHPKRAPITNLTAAAFREDEIVVANAEAVARLREGRWTIEPNRKLPTPRRIVPFGADTYLAIGTDRHLYSLSKNAELVPWGARLPRFAIHGIVPTEEGRDSAYLVGGSTDTGRGLVARLDGERITIIAEELEVKTLFAASLLPDGSLIAVGRGGHVARLRGGAVIEVAKPCDGDLHVVGVTQGDTVVAGAGAWAFRIKTAPLSAELEPVDTTSNLLCMAIDAHGTAWIGGERGRLMRRRDKHWRRMNKPFPGDPTVLAIHARPEQMRAILSDGTIAIGEPVEKRS